MIRNWFGDCEYDGWGTPFLMGAFFCVEVMKTFS